MFHQLLDQAEPGDQVGILMRGVKRDEVRRGQFVVEPKSMSIHDYVQCQVSFLVLVFYNTSCKYA